MNDDEFLAVMDKVNGNIYKNNSNLVLQHFHFTFYKWKYLQFTINELHLYLQNRDETFLYSF